MAMTLKSFKILLNLKTHNSLLSVLGQVTTCLEFWNHQSMNETSFYEHFKRTYAWMAEIGKSFEMFKSHLAINPALQMSGWVPQGKSVSEYYD